MIAKRVVVYSQPSNGVKPNTAPVSKNIDSLMRQAAKMGAVLHDKTQQQQMRNKLISKMEMKKQSSQTRDALHMLKQNMKVDVVPNQMAI